MAGWESAPLADEAPSSAAAAWQSAPLAEEAPASTGIDFSRPVPEVRAAIAQLPSAQRPAALRQWADSFVDNERRNNPSVQAGSNLPDLVRNVARGTLVVGPILDELSAGTQGALHSISGGRLGSPYDEAIEYQRATDRAIDRDNPVASMVTQVAGGLATGGPVARAVMSGAGSLVGKAARGAGIGTAAGYWSGVGHGEGDLAERQPSGLRGAGFGLALGATLPPVIAGVSRGANALSEAASPTIARWGANIDSALQNPTPLVLAGRRIGLLERPRRSLSAAADGGGDYTPPVSGADAAGQQVLALQLQRSGRSVDDLRTMLSDADRSRTFHTSGVAQNRLALVDLDPSLQRLGGSIARQNPEAAGIGNTFLDTRMTGLTPTGRALEPNAGIPHRPAMSPPLTGREAERQFGTRFDTPEDKIVPTGQTDTVLDGFRRALRIEDEVYHGHGANAYRTQQAMERSLKTEASKLYPDAWRQAEDFDLTPAFANLQRAAQEINDPAVHGVFRRVERLFTRPDGNGAPLGLAAELRRVDVAKQRLDGLIERFQGKDSFLYRALTQFKHDVLNSVHGGDRLAPTRNAAYSEARNFYFTEKQKQEAIEAGRAAFRGDSDVGIDAFRAMESEAQRKFFRLGLHGEAEKLAKSREFGRDATRLFNTPRMDALLAEVIPATRTATGRVKIVGGQPAAFSDRPERFGKFIGNERRQVQTRNVVQGGSSTQRNIQDDEALDSMNKVTTAFQKFRQSGSLANTALEAITGAVEKIFGMRNDTAVAIARQLYTADEVALGRILANIERRMGPTRMAEFVNAVSRASEVVPSVGARQATQPEQR